MSDSKKKILIINSYFKIGGIESALINMVNELCKYYSVDLLVYYPEGPMKDKLDSEINIINPSFALKAMGMTLTEAVKSKNILIILFRLFASVWSHIFDNRFPIYIASKIQPKIRGYDLAIAFRAETRKTMILSGFARILDRCVEAKTKMVWIHYDASNFTEYYSFNERYYKKMDKIVGVSKSVAKAFESANPEVAEKTDFCYNFLDYNKVLIDSEVPQKVEYPENAFVCFSACRLSEEKGLLRGIEAIAPVMKEHKDVFWYIAGDGPERKSIEGLIESKGLKGRIVLLGNQNNPYPYMKNSDLYLSLSFHEAAPVVYMEAKTLHVPVFTTETSSSYEMLRDGIEDFICENSEEGIRTRFAEIMTDRSVITNAKNSLKNYCGSNEESLKKIADWINM